MECLEEFISKAFLTRGIGPPLDWTEVLGVSYYWEWWSYFLGIGLVGVRAHQLGWSGFEPARPT